MSRHNSRTVTVLPPFFLRRFFPPPPSHPFIPLSLFSMVALCSCALFAPSSVSPASALPAQSYGSPVAPAAACAFACNASRRCTAAPLSCASSSGLSCSRRLVSRCYNVTSEVCRLTITSCRSVSGTAVAQQLTWIAMARLKLRKWARSPRWCAASRSTRSAPCRRCYRAAFTSTHSILMTLTFDHI